MASEPYPWGEVVKVHTIGTHTITEYIVGKAWHNGGNTEFGTGDTSFDTLDQALLYSLCDKTGDPDAMLYIEKMLGGLR